MATDVTTGSIQSRKDFKETKTGQYKYWDEELKASEKNLRLFRKLGSKTVQRYKGGNKSTRDASSPDERGGTFRLNLFHANVTTLESMLYGRVPKVDVSRRHSDPSDDIGRVASNIMSRVLNNDIQDRPEDYDSVLKAALQDRLLPGVGVAKVRYVVETEMQSTAVVVGDEITEQQTEVTTFEDAPIEYVHWRDVSWGWSRTFADLPWIAFRSYLSKDEVQEKWGEDAANGVELKNQAVTTEKDETQLPDEDGPWQKAEIWEIWDKSKRKVIWLSQGYDKILETKDDFLKLDKFYPCPPFLLANQTTSLYTPVSDFYIAQDLYNEVDTLQTRISIITEAIKVVGVYDQSAGDSVGRMLKEGTDNDLIPVDNWALFAEKGGLKGVIDWFPIGEVTEALGKLIELRDQSIALLQQTTGMSDIMRGELTGQYEGVGQSKMKAKYGSLRVQSLQETFAQFATGLVSLKAEIISKHFEPETIAKLGSVSSLMEADRPLIQPAIQLIKDFEAVKLRIVIKSESMAMVDYQEQQAERSNYLGAIGKFLQAATPLIQGNPESTPLLLQLMQWGLAGFKGADEIEGVVDKAVQQAEQASQKPKKPDPEQAKMQGIFKLEQMKLEGQMKLEQMKGQIAMQQLQSKAQADIQTRQADMEADIKTRQADLQADLQKIQADLQADLMQLVAKMKADIQTEIATSQANAEQQTMAVENEIVKESIKTENEIRKEGAKNDARPDNA